MSEGVVSAFLFACVICPIFSSNVILERQSAVDVHPIPGVGEGVGVRGGGGAAYELVVMDDNDNTMRITNTSFIPDALCNTVTVLCLFGMEENIGTPLESEFELNRVIPIISPLFPF